MRDEPAVLVELGDAVVGADAVGDIDVAGLVPRHIGRTGEAGSGDAGARRAPTLAAADPPPPPRRAAAAPPADQRAPHQQPAPPPAPAPPPPRRRVRPHANRFRLASEHEADAAIGIELHDLVGRDVDRPDVVLRIDAQANRGIEAIDVLAPFAHEVAVAIEHEQPRAAVRERAVVAERRVRMSGARVDVDLALRIGADAGHFADVDVLRASSAIDGTRS